MYWVELASFVSAGVFATAVIDVFGILLHKIFGFPKMEWRFIGRWVFYMRSMKFFHGANGGHISRYSSAPGELAIGWIFHYAVGIVFSLTYFSVMTILQKTPDIPSATLFGAITLVAPWFVMAPSLGNGFFSSRHPRKNLMRILSIMAHLTFGQSLYLWWYIAGGSGHL